ncbi:MAG TPA: tetratricopeptide repeat protein [Burkholderiales bacterium]
MTKTLSFLFAFALAGAAGHAVAQAEPKELNEPTLYELLLGEIAMQRGDYALAAKTYLNLARRLNDARIARRAVEVALKGNQPEIALEAAQLWLKSEPDSPQALEMVARMLVTAQRVDDAEPYFEKLFALPAASPENGFLQINRLLGANPDKKANLHMVRRLAQRYPKLAQAHFAVAQAAAIAGDDAAAIAAARQAQALRPDWDAAVLIEVQLLQKRSMPEAAARLGEFVGRNPAARDARLAYARLLTLDKRYAEARAQFEALLAANPGNTDVVYSVGLVAFQLKDYTAAEDYMKRLLSTNFRDPDGVRYILGQVAEEQKRWPDAVRWYEQIKDGDQAMPARLRTANAIAKQGRLDEARALLREVAKENPDQLAQITVAEAQLLRDANLNRDAFDMLDEALRREPEQPELLYDYALTAEKLERFDLLEQNLRKLIVVRPDHAHAYNALGYSFADRNIRLAEARKLIEKALEITPDDFFIIDSLGWVQYREGKLKDAAATLRRAYGGRPDAEIGAHLGEVLWALGERDEAKRVWQEALQAGPDNETLQKTIKRFQP